MKNLLQFFFAAWSLVSISFAQVRTLEGQLVEFITAYADAQPRKGSEGFLLPTPSEKSAWQRMMKAFLGMNWEEADNQRITHFPFLERILFLETGRPDRVFMILLEQSPIRRGWGVYVRNLSYSAMPWTIEIPHPKFDTLTETQGASLFMQINGYFLMMAGANRCANAAYSGCSGTTTACLGTSAPYPVSDVAHTVESPFHWTHEALHDPLLVPHNMGFINLHGHSSEACEDVFLSSTVSNVADGLIRALHTALIHPDWTVGFAGDGITTCSLTGTTNVQGRFTNESPNPCTKAATKSNGRFIHIEQSLRVRQSAPLTNRIGEALQKLVVPLEKETLPKPNTGFTLAPNPVQNKVFLHLQTNQVSEGQIRVYDLMGHNIYQANVLMGEGSPLPVLDVRQWPNGRYIVEVSGQKFVFRTMMMVVH